MNIPRILKKINDLFITLFYFSKYCFSLAKLWTYLVFWRKWTVYSLLFSIVVNTPSVLIHFEHTLYGYKKVLRNKSERDKFNYRDEYMGNVDTETLGTLLKLDKTGILLDGLTTRKFIAMHKALCLRDDTNGH